VNAPRVPRTRPVTSVVNQVTSPVIATTQLLRVLAVVVAVVEDSMLVVVAAVDLKSATSAPRLVTLLATALRLVAMVAEVDMAVNKADMVVGSVVVEAEAEEEDRLATLVVVMATCLATVPRVKSATTAVRLVISPGTAHPKPAVSALAISASNPDMFRLNARTKSSLYR